MPELEVLPELQVNRVLGVSLDPPVQLVQQVHLVHEVRLVHLGVLGLRDRLEDEGPRDLQVEPVRPVLQGTLVLLVL